MTRTHRSTLVSSHAKAVVIALIGAMFLTRAAFAAALVLLIVHFFGTITTGTIVLAVIIGIIYGVLSLLGSALTYNERRANYLLRAARRPRR